MLVKDTEISGLQNIAMSCFGGARGFFAETYNQAHFAAQGILLNFVQDNHALFAQIATVRGLHFQAPRA